MRVVSSQLAAKNKLEIMSKKTVLAKYKYYHDI
jgi:hypothetical protein